MFPSDFKDFTRTEIKTKLVENTISQGEKENDEKEKGQCVAKSLTAHSIVDNSKDTREKRARFITYDSSNSDSESVHSSDSEKSKESEESDESEDSGESDESEDSEDSDNLTSTQPIISKTPYLKKIKKCKKCQAEEKLGCEMTCCGLLTDAHIPDEIVVRNSILKE